MNRITWCAGAALIIAIAPIGAQTPGRPDGRAPLLRARVEEAFLRRAKQDLSLTDDQSSRLARVLEASGTQRAELDQADRRARQALAAQLRPGIAANGDSVTKLLDAIAANRVAHAETFRAEMRELAGILSPVQRGQFLLLRDRMLDQVRNMTRAQPAGPQRRPPL